MLVSNVSILPAPVIIRRRRGQRGFTRQASTVVKTARRLHVRQPWLWGVVVLCKQSGNSASSNLRLIRFGGVRASHKNVERYSSGKPPSRFDNEFLADLLRVTCTICEWFSTS